MDKTNSLKKPFSPYFKNVEIEDGEDELDKASLSNQLSNNFTFWQDQEE